MVNDISTPGKMKSWQESGYDGDLTRPNPTPSNFKYIGGADFDAQLDDMLLSRMFRLKGLSQAPQGYEPGKMYWDKENKKYKLWVDDNVKWVDITWSSTSTTTTSSSSSSTSTTTTSSSSTSTTL